MARLQQWITLSWAQRWLFVRAWLLSGYYVTALSRRPLKTFLGSASHSASPGVPVSPGQAREAVDIGRLAGAAASAPPWRGRCLLQALVGRHLLRSRGIAGELVLGVNRNDGDPGQGPTLHAHAWLRVGDAVVCGATGQVEFTTLARYPWAEIAPGRPGRYIGPTRNGPTPPGSPGCTSGETR